jgi:RNA polymerase sigma-70 factor (ECF subfamily)
MNPRHAETTLLPHLDSAYNLARWLTKNDDDARDVAQEAFSRALRFLPGLQGSPKPWLMSIVRNTFYTWAEHNGRHDAEPFDEDRHGSTIAELGPEILSIRNADVARVRAAVERLASEYREAIVLRELEGYSYAEIAEITGVPVGTVMSRISRGRAKAQEHLRRGGQ